MINFNFETQFQLKDSQKTSDWIASCIHKNDFTYSEINYIFCDDKYLHKINMEYLQHDTLTDIISFDYTMGKEISGDIFISIERVEENAKIYQVSFQEEFHRVLIHGILHYMGYKDKSEEEKEKMREKENDCLQLLHKI
ncbi:rRNA maturation RNase YbeY [Tenacibaculum sp. SG-28]|uniref:rRNA maturation RNase YbeY n=1 Tax=Tenacibaculum sp. SG-28 TaxID=754426 RepID=UPI000CF38C6D|nr:rRNA maturation RNase YbeY [Tenacibaculum sp. SG-28]PQJ21824.1 rRNA maturation RNase YbeY [Tenacibaculum sp. SG-28]